jgi:hypothetical protein
VGAKGSSCKTCFLLSTTLISSSTHYRMFRASQH